MSATRWQYPRPPALFFGLGIIAAAIHNIFDGHPAIGASGAINGVVGMVLVLYPRNEVACFWFIFMRGGMFYISSIWLILLWLAFDVWGVVTGDLGVAYRGHIGGLLGGAAVAMLMLKTGLIETADTEQTLLDILEQRCG